MSSGARPAAATAHGRPPGSSAVWSRVRGRQLPLQGTDRACWTILLLAALISALLCLHLTRGLTYHADDLLYFDGSDGARLSHLFGPHNGHLIVLARLFYAACFALFGAAHYLPFRIAEVVGVVAVAVVVFAYAKRKVGPTLALPAAVLLLFLGGAWQDSLDPVGVVHTFAIAFGLSALLVLDVRPRGADLAACALLILSIATFSSGLAFVVGVAVVILTGDDRRRRRSWVVLVPVALYLIWVIAPKAIHPPFTEQDGFALSNVLLHPQLRSQHRRGVECRAHRARLQLHPTCRRRGRRGLGIPSSPPASRRDWSFVSGVEGLSSAFWGAGAVLLTLWILGALVTHYSSEPDQDRYLYDGAVLVLVVAAAALEGVRVSRTAALCFIAATVAALATNLDLLRVGSGSLRGESLGVRAQMTALTIARGQESPSFVPQGIPTFTFIMGIIGGAGPYLAATERNGDPGFTVAELRAQPEATKQYADQALAGAEGLALAPAGRPVSASRCRQIGDSTHPVDIAVRSPGLVLRSTASLAATLHRFAGYPTARAGELGAGQYEKLTVRADGAPDPWRLFVPHGPLTVCPSTG